MSFVVWAAVSFLVGILVFLATPLVVAPILPTKVQHGLASRYYWLSMQALRRGGLVRRIHGGWDMVHSQFDGEKTAERVQLAGEERYFKDPLNFMTRFYKRPFFIAYERYNAIVDPRIADMGERLEEIQDSGEYKMERIVEMDDGSKRVNTYYAKHFGLPTAERVVELAKSPIALLGGSKPEDGKTVEEWTKASQSGFRESKAWDYVQILTAYAVPVALMWFVTNYGKTAAPNISGPSVGLLIGVVPV